MATSKIKDHEKWDCVVKYDGEIVDTFHFWASGIRDAMQQTLLVMPIRDFLEGLELTMTRRGYVPKETK